MPELTVASFNVHWGHGLRRHGFVPFDVVATSKELEADVVVLQEVWVPDAGPTQLDQLTAGLEMEIAATVELSRARIEPHPHITGRGDSSGDGGWHLSILTRLPVLRRSTYPLPHSPVDPSNRMMHVVDVDVDGTTVAVAGTHFTHLEFGALLHRRHLRRTLPDQGPAVLAGDLNMWRWCAAWMVPPGWRNVVRGRTYPAHRSHSQIDHILVTSDVDVVWSEVMPEQGSDHRAVRARLRV